MVGILTDLIGTYVAHPAKPNPSTNTDMITALMAIIPKNFGKFIIELSFNVSNLSVEQVFTDSYGSILKSQYSGIFNL
jgi:hypothetical protein